jgi:hypothetical protein
MFKSLNEILMNWRLGLITYILTKHTDLLKTVYILAVPFEICGTIPYS